MEHNFDNHPYITYREGEKEQERKQDSPNERQNNKQRDIGGEGEG